MTEPDAERLDDPLDARQVAAREGSSRICASAWRVPASIFSRPGPVSMICQGRSRGASLTDSIPLDNHVHIVLVSRDAKRAGRALDEHAQTRLFGPHPMVFILAPRLVKSSIDACRSSRSARRAAMSLFEGAILLFFCGEGGARHQVLPRSRRLELPMRSFFRMAALIADFERRRVFRPILAPIVEARGRDVRVTQPFLHLRNIGLVLEGVGRRGGAQRVRADRDAELLCIATDEFVNPVRRERLAELAGAVVADRAEEGGGLLAGVAGGL